MRWVGLRALGAAGAAAVLLAGCGGNDDASERPRGGVAGAQQSLANGKATRGHGPRWATAREIRWLQKLARWNADFADAGERVAAFEADKQRFERVLAGDEAALAAYEEALRPIRGCGQSFRSAVGRAPTERLHDSEQRFLESCDHFRRGVDLLLRALAEKDDGLAQRARYQLDDATKQADVAVGTLPPGEKQPLPRKAGDTATSRIEPTYSRVASRIGGKPIEIRCWSASDWKRLLVEEKAFTGGKINDNVLGFASAGGKRINLAPPICSSLGSLTYGDAAPADEKKKYGLALAVVTLTHETVHATGTADEQTAECHGIQLAERAARMLGVSAGYAASMVDLYWSNYPNIPKMYRSPECRNGGELDLRKRDASFP